MNRGFIWRMRERAKVVWVLLTRRLKVERQGDPTRASVRVLYVANSFLPTLQLAFVKPLQALAERHEAATELLSQQQMKQMWSGRIQGRWAQRWVRRRFERFDPTVVVFCRYSGPHARLLLDLAEETGVPSIYHIDDDLLNVPAQIGEAKHRYHNDPARLQTVRLLLERVDVVYCSTAALLARLRAHGLARDGIAGRAHCAGEVLRGAPKSPRVKIGYMGIDHAHDFEVALPALARVLRECPQADFEIFGPMAVPQALREFGARVTVVPPVPNYDQFLRTFTRLDWAIGICPLAETPFNALKSNNKWVEYTSVGAAVVATAGTIYDECGADGCSALVNGDAQWEAALLQLVREPAAREAMVARAQARLASDYSVEALRKQVLGVFQLARQRASQRREANPRKALHANH
jgi:glycosyltransferase involved in cell wall biosynthesis